MESMACTLTIQLLTRSLSPSEVTSDVIKFPSLEPLVPKTWQRKTAALDSCGSHLFACTKWP